MKYKLINRATNEAHICDKVTVKGFDYYLDVNFIDIATNNPNSHIPKVIDEVEVFLRKEYELEIINTDLDNMYLNGLIEGYNKSQETPPNSDEDMIEFAISGNYKGFTKEYMTPIFELWKSKQPKVLYYEAN